jgi:indolepyruvate ferredoxin oxidoreductase alpha subunit
MDAKDFGIVMQGGLYNSVLRSLELLGLADAFGQSQVPLYVLNVTYPLIDDEFKRFCLGKRGILLVEEGQPDFIEQASTRCCARPTCRPRVHGKDVLPMAGEYTGGVVLKGVARFIEQLRARAAGQAVSCRPPRGLRRPGRASMATRSLRHQGRGEVQGRPPSFCTGCPERPIFTAMKLVERELGKHHISCDIGCHLFSVLPPFNIGATTMGYGLGWAGASAFNTHRDRQAHDLP